MNGKWRIVWRNLISDDKEPIAALTEYGQQYAGLIQAAPELMEAGKAILREYDIYQSTLPPAEDSASMGALRSAIAKAEAKQ